MRAIISVLFPCVLAVGCGVSTGLEEPDSGCYAAWGEWLMDPVVEDDNPCVLRNVYPTDGETVSVSVEEDLPCGVYEFSGPLVRGPYTYNLSWWAMMGPSGPEDGGLSLAGGDLYCEFGLAPSE